MNEGSIISMNIEFINMPSWVLLLVLTIYLPVEGKPKNDIAIKTEQTVNNIPRQQIPQYHITLSFPNK